MAANDTERLRDAVVLAVCAGMRPHENSRGYVGSDASPAALRDSIVERVMEALTTQPPAVSVDWRDGFPPLTRLDDKPCKGPDGRPIPPMRESDEVIVCTDEGRVVMDHCCAIGDGMPLWFLNARRVIGWMPKPAALNPEAPDA